jgi:PEP-CTERM motif-containing protein
MQLDCRMGRLHLVSVILASCICAVGYGQTVQLRDAVTGENEDGVPPGFFLTGTGSIISATNGTDEFFRELHTGTYDFEIDRNMGAGWEAFLTYCLELNQQIGFGVHTPDNTAVGLPYQVTSLSSYPGFTSADENALETLWANAFADSTTSRVKAAAFQSIAWELANDSSVDFLSGNYKLDTSDPHTADVLAQANAWYTNIQNGTWTSHTDLLLLTNPDSQDFLIPVPEPATLSMLLLGCGALLRRRRA